MNDTSLLALVSAIATIIGGGVTAAVARFMLSKYISDNDQKHAKREEAIEREREKSVGEYKELYDKLSDISVNLAKLSESMLTIAHIKKVVDQDHDQLIRLGEWNTKYKDDLLKQFDRIRLVEEGFTNFKRDIETKIKELNHEKSKLTSNCNGRC